VAKSGLAKFVVAESVAVKYSLAKPVAANSVAEYSWSREDEGDVDTSLFYKNLCYTPALMFFSLLEKRQYALVYQYYLCVIRGGDHSNAFRAAVMGTSHKFMTVANRFLEIVMWKFL